MQNLRKWEYRCQHGSEVGENGDCMSRWIHNASGKLVAALVRGQIDLAIGLREDGRRDQRGGIGTLRG
jgi:hypothetical protein